MTIFYPFRLTNRLFLLSRKFIISYRRISSASGTSSENAETYPALPQITNSLTRKKEQLRVSNPPILRWYACGPTVYDSSHLGHAYSYMQFDLIRRVLEEFRGVNVVQVMNITDIDDKIIARANETNTLWMEISKHYRLEFEEDLLSLGIKPATVTAKISDSLPQIIQFVQRLIDCGIGYVAPSGTVYFDVDKYGRYGKFQKIQETQKKVDPEKRSASDFALWKGAKPNEPSWSVPFSSTPGRPGWHVECSAVATHFFGSTLDLHSGGTDLMFPHHENEEAQCCAFHGVTDWVGQWMHTGQVVASDSSKMSKSVGNFISIRDYREKFSGDQFRMLCMRHHYRSNCMYSEEEISMASDAIAKYTSFLNTVSDYLTGNVLLNSTCINDSDILQKLSETESAVQRAISDDFDFPQALRALFDLVSTCHKQLTPATTAIATSATSFPALSATANYIDTFFRKCGLILPTKRNLEGRRDETGDTRLLSPVMDSVLEFRRTVRQGALAAMKESPELSKTVLSACDKLRLDLNGSGITVKDVGKTSTWELQVAPNLLETKKIRSKV